MTLGLRKRYETCVLSAVVLLTSVPCTARAQEGRLPIIDVHVHAYRADFLGQHPVNPVTGVPAVASTDRELQAASIAAMRRLNIVHAVAGGPLDIVAKWKAAEPDLVIASAVFPFPGGWPRVDSLRAAYQSGALQAMGELTLQYEGASLSSEEVEPYLALAEELGPIVKFAG